MRYAFLFLCLPLIVTAAEPYAAVTYPPSKAEGELQFGVTYTVWIPPGVKTLRGVIVHQHGCGAGACKGGATAAFDLHWQALAKKWDCALLGPSYQQEDGQNCRLWCDPRNGSGKAFLKCLTDLAAKSGHPELETVPWCLWGHSGGGFWASLMQTMHPDRIVAIWFRSGTALVAWQKGEIKKPDMPEAMYGIPMMLNPGGKENGDKRFGGIFPAYEKQMKDYGAKGAPIGFAADPNSNHDCGTSRYLAIPWFDACLAMRLPDKPGGKLKPAANGVKDEKGGWLPNEAVGKIWKQYTTTGIVADDTPPPAPSEPTVTDSKVGKILTWTCEADFESGLQGFLILRDGKEIGRVPEKPVKKFGSTLFQSQSYHDTPETLPKMEFLDKEPVKGAVYKIIAVNGAGLRTK